MSYGVGLRNGVAFALGTIPSLTSGGGLRPSLLLNFLSGTLDSRITFSRGTQATQYTSNGTLQYAPNNLLTYSNQADNAAWTKSNSFVQTNLLLQSQTLDNAAWSKTTATVTADTAIAPDGTSTADTVTATTVGANTGFISQTVTLAASTNYVYSMYVKHGTESSVMLQAICTVTGVNSGCFATFNVSNGTVSTASSYGSVSGATASITSSINGYYRCTLVLPVPAGTITGGAVWFFPYSGSDAANTYAYAWGAQLVQGSVPGDYRATTSAALPVLYADYQGNLRARKLCENSSTSRHEMTPALPVSSIVAGATYTISINAKAAERSAFVLFFSTGETVGDAYAVFNLAAGTVNFSSGTTGAITSVGNGVYRCSMPVTTVGTTLTPFVGLLNALSTSRLNSYAGDGSSGIYIADAQLEAGSTVQAYNDTTSAAYYGPRFDYDPTNYVRQNLLLQSQTFDNASWITSEATVVANADIAPDGTLTADKFIPSTTAAVVHTLRQSITVTGGAFSIYAKAAGETTFSLWFVAAGQGVLFDLAAGTTSTISGGISSTITNVGNGWYRCTGAFTGATTLAHVYGRNGSGFAGDGTSGVLFWGAQLNTGSTALTYTATTTVPYTLCAARGLLIEEQRVNLLLQSNDFQTSWSPTNITRTLASTTGPDGTLSGVKLEATASAVTTLFQSATVAATSATFSVFVKQGSGATIANEFLLRNSTTLTNLVRGTLNFSTGVWTYSVGSTGVVVTNTGNGWWRLQISATAGITSGDSINVYVGFTGLGQVAGEFLYAYGAQLEAGAFATSYIPTVGSQVTRAADSASITTLTPWFNAAAGTMVIQADRIYGGNAYAAALVFRNTATGTNDRYDIGLGTGAGGIPGIYRMDVVTGGVTQAALGDAQTFAANTVYKGALAVEANNFASSTQGAAAATDTSGSMPTGINEMTLGSRAGGNFLNGHIQAVSYYQTRLPNATLQGLTV